MKKSLIALAVLAASGAAMAQSTVTLYGLIDASIQVVKTPSYNTTTGALTSLSQTNLTSGGQNGSRWGLKGSEDLGGGLNAVFDLQSGFNVDTGVSGQGGALFGRHAFVGLSGGFGTLTFGRHDTSYDDVKGNVLASANNSFDAANGAGVSAATYATIVNPAATAAQILAVANIYGANTGAWTGYNSRVNNSIKYQTNNYGGFSAGVTYGLGEDKTATVKATHTLSLNAQYANGPIGAAVAYQEETLSKTAAKTVYLKNTLIGGSYDFGVAKLYAAYNQAKVTDIDSQKESALGVSVPVGALTLRAEVARSKGDLLGKNSGYDLEALYDLSKRTTVYTSYVSTKHEVVDDKRTSAFAVGLRHKF
ncbi:putative porin [Rhodoferax ferrireducens]|uniref:Porin n=1 Tax=Rhodoferax ferrireducens TaxID=192843 RepID=A0ABU2CDR7_9BURK|nr:porin [Rhodoferax ferrireducens]MDR7379463.1 putative porin [Rhodoferax ferrireducens]